MKNSKHLQLSVAFSACDGKGRRRPESRGVAASFVGQQPNEPSLTSLCVQGILVIFQNFKPSNS
jgi:hypothetical protein